MRILIVFFIIVFNINADSAKTSLNEFIKKDHNLSVDFLEKACDLGVLNLCMKLAYKYYEGNDVSKNKANEVFTKLCDSSGLKEACHYVNKFNTIKNNTKLDNNSTNYISKLTYSCNNGDVESCTRLGKSYKLGISIEINKKLAIKYLSKACDNNSGEGCLHLSSYYYKNNKTKALSLLQKACDSGIYNGCKFYMLVDSYK